MIGRCRELLCLLIFGLGSAALYAGPVNINTADAETLALELTGVGPALAAAIIEDREMNGDFESPPNSGCRARGIDVRVVATVPNDSFGTALAARPGKRSGLLRYFSSSGWSRKTSLDF